mmetsp:Transcript_9213/g.15455  ORF Transcript_9213/g.15455 Transcript_9213/m.15455 type:complete len:231 (-) Transcript_9213:963-1655(-)
MELGDERDPKQQRQQQKEPVCFFCGKSETSLSKCSKCRVASYCSRDCQVKDWKTGSGLPHKHACQSYARIGLDSVLKTEDDQIAVRGELFGRVRFYVCPYAVHKSSVLGKGFLFLQSDRTLAELSLLYPKTTRGHPMGMRSLLVHFLTMGEYDTEVCRDDFELAVVRTALQATVDNYDEQTSVVLLMRFRCGHIAVGKAPLVPDYGICKSLGKDYYSQDAGALQLNIDDV